MRIMSSSRFARECTPQRSPPIPIATSGEFGNFAAINDGDVPTVTAASLQARASDAALRDYLCGNKIAIATRRLDGVEAQNQTD